MSTTQAVIDGARALLNDDDKVRYTDAAALPILAGFVSIVRSIRPDTRFGAWTAPEPTLALGTAFPLPAKFEPVAQHYLIARFQTKDDEAVNAGLSDAEYQRFLLLVKSV